MVTSGSKAAEMQRYKKIPTSFLKSALTSTIFHYIIISLYKFRLIMRKHHGGSEFATGTS